MKIVLVSARDNYLKKMHTAPLGLLYVASTLEAAGHEVIVIDSQNEELDNKGVLRNIISIKPDAVGITGTTENRFIVIELFKMIKEALPSVLTIWGGPHATLTSRDAIDKIVDVDIIVKGEGEITTPEFLEAYSKTDDLGKIQGIIYRSKEGSIIETPDRPFISDLNTLPLPARHLVDMDKYIVTVEGEYKTRAAGIISLRGCPYDCYFCANGALGLRKVRKRSPENVVAEMEYIVNKYKIDGFNFWDDSFTIDEAHLRDICSLIIKRGLDIKWFARAPVNTINAENIKLMRKAGCVSIGIGAESGSEKVLRAMNKTLSLNLLEATNVALNEGMVVKCTFMVSLPEETEDDLKLTFDLIDRLKKKKVVAFYSFTRIYPMTKFEYLAKERGIMPKDFSWNSPYEFKDAELLGSNPSLPMYSNGLMSHADIKFYVARRQNSLLGLLFKGLKKIFCARNMGDIKILIHFIKELFHKKARLGNGPK
ncbi:MAG: radical SAM protein [Candidatus Omnitrophota bacterium]|jgi:radical SAM superfamily enzyme YgiQ (UPF0313 family)